MALYTPRIEREQSRDLLVRMSARGVWECVSVWVGKDIYGGCWIDYRYCFQVIYF